MIWGCSRGDRLCTDSANSASLLCWQYRAVETMCNKRCCKQGCICGKNSCFVATVRAPVVYHTALHDLYVCYIHIKREVLSWISVNGNARWFWRVVASGKTQSRSVFKAWVTFLGTLINVYLLYKRLLIMWYQLLWGRKGYMGWFLIWKRKREGKKEGMRNCVAKKLLEQQRVERNQCENIFIAICSSCTPVACQLVAIFMPFQDAMSQIGVWCIFFENG